MIFDCDCKFDVDPEDPEDDCHYLRTCLACGEKWYGLHCPHDGYQNRCPKCGHKPEPIALKRNQNEQTE